MKPIVIFGASVTGEDALEFLETRELRPVCFVDNDVRKQEKPFHGYKVMSFEDVRSKYPDAIIIIAAKRYFDEIYEQVSPYYEEVYSMTYPTPPENEVVLDQLNVVVTERCTLKCGHCSSLMPLYKHPKDCDTRLLLSSLTRLLDCVSFVNRVEVLGGEPFLNKDLPKIVGKLVNSDKIMHIDVITNGTVVPKLVTYLKHGKVCVVINQYPKSDKSEELIKKLSSAGVIHRRNLHWAWADLGDFKYRNRDPEELETLFKKCNFNSCTELLNGELHRCPRSSHGTSLGLVPNNPDDFVYIQDDPLGVRIKELMRKNSITACNYCNGNTRQTLTLEPAQ